MAKQKKRKASKQTGKKGSKNESITNDAQIECEKEALSQEVEKEIDAIRAMRDVEIAHSLTALRLLRSYFEEAQLQTPVLQFFEENLPNLLLVKNEENGLVEVKWKDTHGQTSTYNLDGIDMRSLLLKRLSLGYFHGMEPLSGFGYTKEAGRTSFVGSDGLLIKDLGQSGWETRRFQDALQTPGSSSQRLSVGMTPKTRRQPKAGEMLLSVHGSPLGVYKEDNNMGAIQEIEES